MLDSGTGHTSCPTSFAFPDSPEGAVGVNSVAPALAIRWTRFHPAPGLPVTVDPGLDLVDLDAVVIPDLTGFKPILPLDFTELLSSGDNPDLQAHIVL